MGTYRQVGAAAGVVVMRPRQAVAVRRRFCVDKVTLVPHGAVFV